MPQAARVVSRVFLDDVASVVSGTVSDAGWGGAAEGHVAGIGPLPVEHKRGKNGLFWLSTGAIGHEMDSGRCRSEDKAST